ncbi:MAG: hypothetical protein D4S01_07445 [Dehalococcoidia bacterium]|nr:MAG: hypothetical protein D4S01_07445 [Dehalococcoidia bacterium]
MADVKKGDICWCGKHKLLAEVTDVYKCLYTGNYGGKKPVRRIMLTVLKQGVGSGTAIKRGQVIHYTMEPFITQFQIIPPQLIPEPAGLWFQHVLDFSVPVAGQHYVNGAGHVYKCRADTCIAVLRHGVDKRRIIVDSGVVYKHNKSGAEYVLRPELMGHRYNSVGTAIACMPMYEFSKCEYVIIGADFAEGVD